MTTTAQRLATLSGLTGASAGAHLLAIRLAGVAAGQMLVSRSGLAVGSALEHLMATAADVQPIHHARWGSGGRSRIVRERLPLGKTKQQRQNEQIFLLLMQ